MRVPLFIYAPCLSGRSSIVRCYRSPAERSSLIHILLKLTRLLLQSNDVDTTFWTLGFHALLGRRVNTERALIGTRVSAFRVERAPV